jgi:hypothetical protein
MNKKIIPSRIESFLSNYKTIIILYFLVATVAPLIQYYQGRINNFIIFQQSTIHFFERVNMYIKYPKIHFDVFLYNPTFALLFAPFAFLNTLLGILLWELFVVFIYFISIYLMPIEKKAKIFVYYFVLIALVPSVQQCQTNPLLIAFILFSFIYLECEQFFKSAFFPCMGFFIKGYGAISGVFFLLKKPKVKTFLYMALWFFLLLLLPLLWYSPKNFIVLYEQWKTSLLQDYSIDQGTSIMGFINSVTNWNVPVLPVQIAGIVLLLFTIVYLSVTKKYEHYKYEVLAYITIWVLIFNHSAEPNTYLISITGIAVWFTQSSKSKIEKALIVFVFIFSVLSTSDVFPRIIRNSFVYPYSIKAVGPILVLIWIQIKFFGKLASTSLRKSTIPLKV